jgi:protein-tyrosine phosphatase
MRPTRFFEYSFLNGLLVGSENPRAHPDPAGAVRSLIERYGLRAMLTLTQEFYDFRIPGLQQHHVPLPNSRRADKEKYQEAVRVVRTHVRAGQPILVHCQRGLDRTGVVIGCYLVSTGRPADEVIEEILSKFPLQWELSRLRELWEPQADRIRLLSASMDMEDGT